MMVSLYYLFNIYIYIYIYIYIISERTSGSNYQISQTCSLRFIFDRILEQNYRYLKVSLVRWKKPLRAFFRNVAGGHHRNG